jgi:hypothetical protein
MFRSIRFPSATRAAVLFAALFAADRAVAQIEISSEENPSFLELEANLVPVLEAFPDIEDPQVEPQLINGRIVDPTFFPAVLRMTTGGTCTATLIGPATVLLAAHCVANNSQIAFRAGSVTVRGICRHAPDYDDGVNMGSDIALCLLRNNVLGIAYESVSFSLPNVGEELTLSGYGCTAEGLHSDGIFRIGNSIAINPPPSLIHFKGTLYTQSRIDAGQAVLCPGDSGGPLYRMSGEIDDTRRVLGVNSRTTYSVGISLFAALGYEKNRRFIEDFAEDFEQGICGHNLLEGCG